MSTTTFVDNQLREYTIAEAERIGVQADAMAGRLDKATELFGHAVAGLAATAEQINKTLQSATAAIAEANQHAQELREERDACFRIRDRLRRDAAEGKPFEGVLLVQS